MQGMAPSEKTPAPEERARETVDAMLSASGWVVQTKDKINLSASRGVAICELSFKIMPLLCSAEGWGKRINCSAGICSHCWMS